MSSSPLISQSLQAPGLILVYRDGNYVEFNDWQDQIRNGCIDDTFCNFWNIQCTVFDKTRHLLLPVEHTVQKFRVSKKS